MPRLLNLMLFFLLFIPTMIVAADTGLNETQSKPLIMGIVSTKPQKAIRRSEPFIEYLAKEMAPFGYTHGEVLVTDDLEEMADLLSSGKVHLTTSTVYAALMLEQLTDVNFAGLRWKKNARQYHSMFFSSNQSGIKNLSDLKGKTIAFEKHTSSSGFFFPANYLISEGYQLQKMQSLNQQPDSDKVGYLFASQALNNSDELNMAIWTYHQKLDASVFSNLNWSDPNDAPNAVKDGLTVIAQTPSYPRGLMLVSSKVNSIQLDVLKQAMYQAHSTGEGKSSLDRFQKTTKIEAIDTEFSQFIDQSRDQLPQIMQLAN
ncbi:phosphate/phosphite/phosphonate ABC transporter substrate-binding protein [Vibrio makurazakiensis]|uniref:PhnD/SsuA/transferrin family substrate-binding protein n=1 Tax=Vibrio makurazakiensis TaxID=2910250 RepID=UPI003D13F4F0